MSFPYRCSRDACRQRVSLRRKVEHYVRPKKCPACGCDTLKLDRWLIRARKRDKCYCAGYPFIHRKGSLRCDYYHGPKEGVMWYGFQEYDLERVAGGPV